MCALDRVSTIGEELASASDFLIELRKRLSASCLLCSHQFELHACLSSDTESTSLALVAVKQAIGASGRFTGNDRREDADLLNPWDVGPVADPAADEYELLQPCEGVTELRACSAEGKLRRTGERLSAWNVELKLRRMGERSSACIVGVRLQPEGDRSTAL